MIPNIGGVKEASAVPTGTSFIQYLPNDILIGNIRPYLKKIWQADKDGGTNGDVVVVRIKDEYVNMINCKFLYYILSSDIFFNYDNAFAKGAKMPRGDKKQILKYNIFIPSLDIQNKVVKILDCFQSLASDINSGIPSEIKARQQQYEYYRDKLLTFKRKV